MNKVNDVIAEIKKNLAQQSASSKDEVKVMQAMLNDKDYKVDVYNSTGKIGEYCPSDEARKMSASIIHATTKVSNEEAEKLASDHVYTRAEAECMVGISKEFVNTYTQTGRKLPLGGRATSNVKLVAKHKDASEKRFPKKLDNGTYANGVSAIPAHDTIAVHGSCPVWLKK